MKPIVFYEKRGWKELVNGMGSFLMAAGAAWVIAVPVCGAVAGVWDIGGMTVVDVILTIIMLPFVLLVLLMMVVGVVFFSWAGVMFIKTIFAPEIILEVLPKGIRGRTVDFEKDLIPWESIYFVRLEGTEEYPAIGIQTVWPVPMWKRLCASQRRTLWKCYHRRQTLLSIRIYSAAASPETILHTIQQELERARQRGLTPHSPEEGGT